MTKFFALAKSNRKRNLSQFIIISFSPPKTKKGEQHYEKNISKTRNRDYKDSPCNVIA